MATHLFRDNAALLRRRIRPGWLFKLSSGPGLGTGTLSVTDPVQYRVYQRRTSSVGDIRITGTYTGTPGPIEASFNGGAWQRICDRPADGAFNGVLTDQAVGQGTLSVRWIGNGGNTVNVSTVGIGDIFIIAGQSNAVGMTAGNQSYSHATLKACMLGNDYAWKELADPVDSSTGQVDTVSTDSAGGSFYPPLATSHMASQGCPVAFVPCAKGGSQISDWAVPSNHLDRSTLWGSMLYRTLQVGGARCVLWWQGESDVINATTRTVYNNALDAVVNTFYTDAGVKFMVCTLEDMSNAGVWTGDESTINLAIGDAWSDNSNVLHGPDLQTLWTPSGDIHYSSAQAAAIAGYWWDALKAQYGWS